jgi:hypothetical protein
VDCGKVTQLLYGSVTYTNGTTYLGSTITYSCVKNYRLVGVASRRCLEGGQWSDESPRCEGKFTCFIYICTVDTLIDWERGMELDLTGASKSALSNVFIYWSASDRWLWRRGRRVAIAIIIK